MAVLIAKTARYFNLRYGGFTAAARKAWIRSSPKNRAAIAKSNARNKAFRAKGGAATKAIKSRGTKVRTAKQRATSALNLRKARSARRRKAR